MFKFSFQLHSPTSKAFFDTLPRRLDFIYDADCHPHSGGISNKIFKIICLSVEVTVCYTLLSLLDINVTGDLVPYFYMCT